MRTLKTSEAAALLHVSPNTLRTWERRFGYPQPARSPGKHRLYAYAQIMSLRDALEAGWAISSAVSMASESFGADIHRLVTALGSFRTERADLAMEQALALRTLERAVEDVLLPALAEVQRRRGLRSTTWSFASTWANEWLRRAQRLAVPVITSVGILIGDATAAKMDPAAPFLHALELCCLRASADVLTLGVHAVRRLDDAVMAIAPQLVVIVGDHADDDDVARWAYSVRCLAPELPFVLYQRGLAPSDMISRAQRLPNAPSQALRTILSLVDCERLSA